MQINLGWVPLKSRRVDKAEGYGAHLSLHASPGPFINCALADGVSANTPCPQARQTHLGTWARRPLATLGPTGC